MGCSASLSAWPTRGGASSIPTNTPAREPSNAMSSLESVAERAIAFGGLVGLVTLTLQSRVGALVLLEQPHERGFFFAAVDVEPDLEMLDGDRHQRSSGGVSGSGTRPSCAISSDSMARPSCWLFIVGPGPFTARPRSGERRVGKE